MNLELGKKNLELGVEIAYLEWGLTQKFPAWTYLFHAGTCAFKEIIFKI
jgi:hypothetical protein